MELGSRLATFEKFRLDAEFREDRTLQCVRTSKSGPRTWQNWKRSRSLGGGNFGKVWQERLEIANGDWQYRAIKVCPQEQMDNAGVDYKRELSALAAFSASKYAGFFVSFHGWWMDSNNVFVAMEYIGKGDLSTYVADGLEEDEAKEVTDNLLNGLSAMHEEGFAHRDIKPQNILVVQKRPEYQRWWVKIGDFGISKRILENSGTSLHTSVGTRPYCAPEVLGYLEKYEQSSVYSSKVDMWSLGCVLFNIGTRGHLAFSESNLVRYVDGRLPFNPTAQKIHFGVDGVSLITWLLEPDPERRIGALEALQHPWLLPEGRCSVPNSIPVATVPKAHDTSLSKESTVNQRNYNSFLQSTLKPEFNQHANLDPGSTKPEESGPPTDWFGNTIIRDPPVSPSEPGSHRPKRLVNSQVTVQRNERENIEDVERKILRDLVAAENSRDIRATQLESHISGSKNHEVIQKFPPQASKNQAVLQKFPSQASNSKPDNAAILNAWVRQQPGAVDGFEKTIEQWEEEALDVIHPLDSVRILNVSFRPRLFVTGVKLMAPFPPPTYLRDLKELAFFDGNLVLDIPMAPKFLQTVPHGTAPARDEFTHMRYTAADCNPAELRERRYTLRPLLFAKPRATEILIEFNMADHDHVVVARTLRSMLDSIRYMSKIFGDAYWKRIVFLIAGSSTDIQPDVYRLLCILGIYCAPYKNLYERSGGPARSHSGNIFEYTSQKSFDIQNDKIELVSRSNPCQLIFVEADVRSRIDGFQDGIANILRPKTRIKWTRSPDSRIHESFIYEKWQTPFRALSWTASHMVPNPTRETFFVQIYEDHDRNSEYTASLDKIRYFDDSEYSIPLREEVESDRRNFGSAFRKWFR